MDRREAAVYFHQPPDSKNCKIGKTEVRKLETGKIS